MAEVILKNIKKIYPHQEPKKKKKGEPEKKNNLQITEEGVLAVDNFNLHIQDKEFIVLVGPSGCGKSTTLRMVAGLEEISGGELYIGGQLMNDVAPKDRDISMVFQNYALYPHMTVRENIAFPLKLRKMDKAEIDQRVEQAAEILDIYNWYVLHHTATFQVTPSSLPEYEDWVDSTRALIPLLLARDGDGKLLGYACAHRYHPREAYDWAVESTIYCAPDARGFGVGDTLYRALLDILDGMGYWNVYALVADPNPASERIHARLGFTCVGREPHTAYKFGWLGLSTWWLPLRRGNEKPEPTHPLTQEQVEEILGRYQA